MDPFTELRKHAGSNHPQKAKVRRFLSLRPRTFSSWQGS